MFAFDPYSPAVDADPFPRLPHPARRTPLLLEPRGEHVGAVALRRHRLGRAGLADLLLGARQPDDRAAQPRRRDAGHHRPPAPRPPACPGATRVHEAQPGKSGRADPRHRRHRRAGPGGPSRVRLHRRVFVQVHRARAVRRTGPANGRRAAGARQGRADGAERPGDARQGPRAHRRLPVDAGLRGRRHRAAAREPGERPDLAVQPGRDRRRPARRARGAADDDDADHGRHRVARRFHEHVRAQPRRPCRRTAGGGRQPGAAARRGGGVAALQHLGAALPPLPAEGRRAARPDDAGGQFRLPRLRIRQPRRAPVPEPGRVRHRAQAARPPGLRRRGCMPASAPRSRGCR